MRYNLTPYNRGEIRETPIESNVIFSESLHVDLSKTIAIESEVKFSEKVNVSAEANRGLVQEIVFLEDIKSEVSTMIAIGGEIKLSERIRLMCEAGKDMSISEKFAENIRASVDVGKDMKELVLFMDELKENAELAKLMYDSIFFSDKLELHSSARSSIEEITVINVELRPGDVLEIDSEFYTVDLNGVNVFDKYHGEWLYLSRDLTDVVVTGNGSGLEAEILYREQYL